jgi:hypothetical protein
LLNPAAAADAADLACRLKAAREAMETGDLGYNNQGKRVVQPASRAINVGLYAWKQGFK